MAEILNVPPPADAGRYKYWIQFILVVNTTPPKSNLEVGGIARKTPIAEFTDVQEIATFLANTKAAELGSPPGGVTITVLSWVRLDEPSLVYLPKNMMQ